MGWTIARRQRHSEDGTVRVVTERRVLAIIHEDGQVGMLLSAEDYEELYE